MDTKTSNFLEKMKIKNKLDLEKYSKKLNYERKIKVTIEAIECAADSLAGYGLMERDNITTFLDVLEKCGISVDDYLLINLDVTFSYNIDDSECLCLERVSFTDNDEYSIRLNKMFEHSFEENNYEDKYQYKTLSENPRDNYNIVNIMTEYIKESYSLYDLFGDRPIRETTVPFIMLIDLVGADSILGINTKESRYTKEQRELGENF